MTIPIDKIDEQWEVQISKIAILTETRNDLQSQLSLITGKLLMECRTLDDMLKWEAKNAIQETRHTDTEEANQRPATPKSDDEAVGTESQSATEGGGS